MTGRRVALSAVAALVVLAGTAAARGDVSPERCASAYANAQLARRKGKLLDARESARVCAQMACPAVGRSDCATWASELDREIPSVVVVARSDGSSSSRAPRVSVDGAVRPEAGAARAIELDPGEHTFRVEREGDLPSEKVIAIFQSERDRILRFDLEPARAIAPAPSPTAAPAPRGTRARSLDSSEAPSYAPAIVFSALGVVALGASAYLGLSGRSDLSGLRASCAPACSDAAIDPVRRKLVASDILLGVGAAASVIGIYFFASPPRVGGDGRPASSGGRAGVEIQGTSIQLRASF